MVIALDREKREAILTAAMKAFGKAGFRKTSIDEIARAAGVAKGTVYLACESKEDLYYQACHRELRSWIAAVARMIDPRVPAEELLATIGQASIVFLGDHPLVRDLLAGECRELLPRWAERFEELRALGRANVIEIVKLGVRQGRFRPDLDVEVVATLLQDLQLASFLLHGSEPAEVDLEMLRRRLRAGLDLVLHGMMVKH
jgi:AcrR family transcriptional regulator